MKYLLIQFDDGTFGYKGYDDKKDRTIVNVQREDENREDFFTRINSHPKSFEYGSILEYDIAIIEKDYMHKLWAAREGYALDIFYHDKDLDIYLAAIEKAYEDQRTDILDKALNGKSKYAHNLLANKGYGLDKLVKDKEDWVRYAVAKRAIELDRDDLIEILKNDKSESIRDLILKNNK